MTSNLTSLTDPIGVFLKDYAFIIGFDFNFDIKS